MGSGWSCSKKPFPKLPVSRFSTIRPSGQLRDVKEVLPVAARALKLTLQPWEVRAADDLEKVFAALNKQRPDGLYVLASPLMTSNRKRIAALP